MNYLYLKKFDTKINTLSVISEQMASVYSIVKESSADLGVNFKIVQNRPEVKAVCTKIKKKIFAYLSIFLYF